MEKKIYYHDTDCGGVVYYANYLKYCEEARTEFMLNRKVNIQELFEKNILFVVKNTTINYKKPARYGDNITIDTCLKEVRNASLYFIHTIKKDDELLVENHTKLACIDKAFRPLSIPEGIAARLRNE